MLNLLEQILECSNSQWPNQEQGKAPELIFRLPWQIRIKCERVKWDSPYVLRWYRCSEIATAVSSYLFFRLMSFEEISTALPPALPSPTCGHVQPSSFFRHCLSVSAVSLCLSHFASWRRHGNKCYLHTVVSLKFEMPTASLFQKFGNFECSKYKVIHVWTHKCKTKVHRDKDHYICTNQTFSHNTILGTELEVLWPDKKCNFTFWVMKSNFQLPFACVELFIEDS